MLEACDCGEREKGARVPVLAGQLSTQAVVAAGFALGKGRTAEKRACKQFGEFEEAMADPHYLRQCAIGCAWWHASAASGSRCPCHPIGVATRTGVNCTVLWPSDHEEMAALCPFSDEIRYVGFG